MTVALVVRGEDLFPDNWIYVHEPDVRVGRIQNFRAWSEAMVPDPCAPAWAWSTSASRATTCGTPSDAELVARATRELDAIGLAPAARVDGGHVVRVPKAYPIYDADYDERVATIRGWLAGIGNLQQIGRNGLHRYNNSDHSMLTAMRAVENACAGAGHDLWAVNADGEYHEEARTPVQPYRDAPETPVLRAEATRSPSAGRRRSARSTRHDGASSVPAPRISWRKPGDACSPTTNAPDRRDGAPKLTTSASGTPSCQASAVRTSTSLVARRPQRSSRRGRRRRARPRAGARASR